MTAREPASVDTDADAPARAALRLSRGITATWWYTFSGILFFELMLVFVWTVAFYAAGRPAVVILIAGVVWAAATVPLLLDYRGRADAARSLQWRRAAVPVGVILGCGVVLALASGTWIVGLSPVVSALLLLHWARGVRMRVVIAGTILLIAVWFIDARTTFPAGLEGDGWLVGFYSTFLPAMTVTTLWWWDVMASLDRARLSEARLAATQERLRVATDVHDLQGHHLQVIALQLELAERLLAQDPDAALEQLRAARASVDDARQGTRDLATRFRAVPLRDELANAADLLRAAGTVTDATVDADADHAPAPVLAPVIREATTNILRHGGGAWARLSLTRSGAMWRLEIANDADDLGDDVGSGEAVGGGAGLPGMQRRVAEAGGTFEVRRGKNAFTVIAIVPGIEERP